MGNKRLLLLLNRDIQEDKDEIGFINDQNIFIPEFVLDYTNNNISLYAKNQ